MALNDGFAVDVQARRIYFPPIGQPRLVPSALDEAKFNGAVFTYRLVAFAGAFVVLLTASAAWDVSHGGIVIFAFSLAVYQLAATLRARRWPALDDPNYSDHRFVISTLRRQSTAWLRCKLVMSASLAIGLIPAAGLLAVKLQSEWAIMEPGRNLTLLFDVLGMPVLALFCAIHGYRIQVALRRQKERRASDPSDEATSSNA